MKKKNMGYTRDDLVEDLKWIWKKNKPIKAFCTNKKGKKKELHLWGLSIKPKRKYIALELTKFNGDCPGL